MHSGTSPRRDAVLILVPGSMGFRSVTSMVGDQYEDGIAIAFSVGIIGISLVALATISYRNVAALNECR